jgi:dimethylamine monooxygenase subunit C
MVGSSLKESATFVSGKRKYMFCGDEQGLNLLKPIIEQVITENLSYETVLMNGELKPLFSNQKMGTFLYVCASWDHLKQVKNLATQCGFSEAEAQFIGYGERKINIFCCRCHGLTIRMSDEKRMTCKHCHIKLEVTDHYSELKDAYLGYVATL